MIRSGWKCVALAVTMVAVAAAGCERSESPGANAEQPPPRPVSVDGYKVISPRRPAKAHAKAPAGRQEHLVRTPTEPDPHAGAFSLEQAVEGLPIDGQLVAEISTDLGTIFCDLYADRVPNTVANFVGLARGRRAFWDARAAAWVLRPAFQHTNFHRVIPGFMIQGGDYLGNGTGEVGYHIPDEVHESLRHDRAGQLCMANRGPNTNGAQFFITDGAAPHLDGSFTIFGQCRPLDGIARIARVPQRGAPSNTPLTAVVINRILIRRVTGGAESARISPPRMPEGYNPDQPQRGASSGPIEIRNRVEERRRLRQEQRGR